ncbi:MAG: hypothetical protein RLZZ50_1137 [Verrucomicrobiota bacterium]|jgi:hypothetical protein
MKTKQLAQETQKLLKTLPKNAEWEDLMYRIYVRQKVDKGLRDSASGRTCSSDEIRKSLGIAT